jgi:adenylate cyclase
MPIERHDAKVVVFVDITGSSQLFVDVGDDRARSLVAATLDRWSVLVTRHQGQVVQLRGDGMLYIFATVGGAVDAVVGMRDMSYAPPLSMHAGIHAGPLLQDSDQLYGNMVNVAARLADIAKKAEIVMSAAARKELPDAERFNLRLISDVPIKGKAEPVDVFLLPDPKQRITEYRPPLKPAAHGRSLKLRYAGKAFVIDADSPKCLIGRDDECRLKVEHALVSRRHASVEYVLGKFFLHEHSTNGT